MKIIKKQPTKSKSLICAVKKCDRKAKYAVYPAAGGKPPKVCRKHIYVAVDQLGSSIVEVC